MTSYQNPEKNMSIVLSSFKTIVAEVMKAVEVGEIEAVLQQIADVTRDLVQVKYVALGIPDNEGSLRFFKTSGISEEAIERIPHRPQGRGLLGAIMNNREILRLERMSDDQRSIGFPENHPEMTSLLGVPVQAGNQLFGMLYLCDRIDGKPFDEQDQWLVESFAGYAALAIAGVQLSEQQSRVTLLEERERVGMELHDGVIQSLYAIGMQLQLAVLSDKLTSEPITNVIKNIDEVINDIRRYILNLKTADYHRVTIRRCIEDVVARLHIPDNITLKINAKDEFPNVSPVVFEAICQITQEALSNAIRHSQAQNIEIIATQKEQIFEVQVSDNGKGFDLASTNDNSGGLGLQNIQQRARLHRGQVAIQTSIGQGTKLTITVPNS